MPKSGKEGESIVTSGETPKRLDLFLAARDPTWSPAAREWLIQGGHIQKSRPARPHYAGHCQA